MSGHGNWWVRAHAVNENAVSRKQRMRENRQSSARRLARRPALSSTERDKHAMLRTCSTYYVRTGNIVSPRITVKAKPG